MTGIEISLLRRSARIRGRSRPCFIQESTRSQDAAVARSHGRDNRNRHGWRLWLFASFLAQAGLAAPPTLQAPETNAAPAATRQAPAEILPPFTVTEWNTTRTIDRDDLAGQIVILDFFAWWCAPCEPASRALHTGIERHYADRAGNPAGIPVRVLSINVEASAPQRTEAFIRRTGSTWVAEETSGELLQQLGGDGLPFLVIVDGAVSEPGSIRFRIVHKQAGLKNADELRGVIDSIGSPPTVADKRLQGELDLQEPRRERLPRVHTVELSPEVAWASDMLMSDTRISYRQEIGSTRLGAAVSYATFDMDYRPFNLVDFFGFEERLSEDRIGIELDGRRELSPNVTVLATAGAYEGYTDYRRVWIANRFRQKYAHPAFPRIPGYEEPDPKGFNVSLGYRWEYLPGTGIAEVRLGFAHDWTAPGYEDSFDVNNNYYLARGREELNTRSVSFSSENVLTPRIRLLNEFSFIDVSERNVRFGYRGSVNVALWERWVFRGSGGVSTEDPQFDAWFAGGTLEYELLPNLLVGLTGRYYEDTGELENSLFTSSAAPSLQSWEGGLSLRYAWSRFSLKLSGGPFRTNYDLQENASAEYTYLYQDRRWGLAQAALSVQF